MASFLQIQEYIGYGLEDRIDRHREEGIHKFARRVVTFKGIGKWSHIEAAEIEGNELAIGTTVTARYEVTSGIVKKPLKISVF